MVVTLPQGNSLKKETPKHFHFCCALLPLCVFVVMSRYIFTGRNSWFQEKAMERWMNMGPFWFSLMVVEKQKVERGGECFYHIFHICKMDFHYFFFLVSMYDRVEIGNTFDHHKLIRWTDHVCLCNYYFSLSSCFQTTLEIKDKSSSMNKVEQHFFYFLYICTFFFLISHFDFHSFLLFHVMVSNLWLYLCLNNYWHTNKKENKSPGQKYIINKENIHREDILGSCVLHYQRYCSLMSQRG